MKAAKRSPASSKAGPIRRAFTLRLKPGSFERYKYFHDNIWPELVREIEACGIAQITTFENDLQLFLYSEIHNEQAWDALWSSAAHDKWAAEMRPLMHFRADGQLDSGPLREIFHLTTAAGKPKAGAKAKRGAGSRSTKKSAKSPAKAKATTKSKSKSKTKAKAKARRK